MTSVNLSCIVFCVLVQQKMAFDGNDPAAAPLLNVSSAEEIMADKPTKYSKVVYFLKDLVTARFHP